MHIPNPYKDIIMTHCMQRRHQGRLCKKKKYSRLKTTGEPKTSQGTTCSYRILHKFLRYYSDMTYPLEEILREDQEFNSIEECNISFETLKRKLVEAPILRFPNWSIKFHVHIDASRLH